MQDKTIFITGGGTGGHIYPAIAIFEELSKQINTKNIFYVGNPKNLEKDIAAQYDINFLPVNVSGMPRKLSFKFLAWSLTLYLAILKSLFYIAKYRPKSIIGTGGYVAFPILMAGILCRVPCYIHDSDAHPGIVTRVVAPFAKKVFLAFDDAEKYIKSNNVIINGNPLRNWLSSISKEEACMHLDLDPNKKTLLIMGGSQGAKSINDATLEIVQNLTKTHNLQVVHQTGKKNYDDVLKKKPEIKEYVVKPYFDNMGIAYASADIAVARAGSISLSELNNCGLPSVLIPYPHAAADHQRHNAKAMESQGAAIVLEDDECNKKNLKKLIVDLIKNESKLKAMSEASKSLAKPEATQNIVATILSDINHQV